MRHFILIVLIIINYSSLAQVNVCACCTNQHKQFDFWLGKWDVYDTLSNKVGENYILTLQDSCIIQENWTSKGMTGTSYNYYNSVDSTWNQLWVDNKGNSLVLKGYYDDGKMILKGTEKRGPKSKLFYDRITWQKMKNGDINQVWDIVDDKGNILSCAFNGIYKRR